jgi:hypothetical protein
MNTPAFSTPRQPFAAFALALTLTLGMLMGVHGLATQGGTDAQLAAAAARTAAAASAVSAGA